MTRAVDGIRGPVTLAQCRRSGTVSRLPLHTLRSRAEAEAFQAAAIKALGGQPCGYKVGATSRDVQRLLNCRGPIRAPILREDVLPNGAVLRIPSGLLGIECEFGFRMARDFPTSGEILTRVRLRSAVADCFTVLEVVGRRVTDDVPLDEISSIADYALAIAVVLGGPIPGWDDRDLSTLPVCAVLDGVTAARGSGGMVLGHPLEALLWLATTLVSVGEQLRAGDIIITGTCTGITKVQPGRVFEGQFADLPPVRLRLEE